MAHIPRENVEILVHTSAPSRGHDDARYRAFARAYIHFEPATYIPLQDDPQAGISNEEKLYAQSQEELQHSTQRYDENASYCPPTQDPETNPEAYQNEITKEELSDLMDSPQLSFRSVFDNRNSPIFRTRSRMALNLSMQSPKEMQQTWLMSSLPAQTQKSSIIDDSMPDNRRILPEFSSPTRALEHHLQQWESTQDSPDVSRKSQFTDESSLNLEVPHAIPVSSFDGVEARINPMAASSMLPRSYQMNSPPPRPHTIRYRDITPFAASSSNADAAHPTEANSSNDIPASGKPANTEDSRTRKIVDSMESTNHDMVSDKISSKEPISGGPEIPETSSALPQHANSKRRRFEFPSSIEKSPKRIKLVISDTTAETSSSADSLPRILPPTSKGPRVENVPSSMPSMSAIPSSDSLAVCTIPSIKPETSSTDLVPASLITPTMAKLYSQTKHPSLEKIFNPTLQTRPCRPFERGYWLVNTEKLEKLQTPRAQIFWSNLKNYISGRHMGWGVSAERTQNWKSFRVNCWGGVVKEIYLMMFLASEGKLRGGYACWKDADGETVISWT